MIACHWLGLMAAETVIMMKMVICPITSPCLYQHLLSGVCQCLCLLSLSVFMHGAFNSCCKDQMPSGTKQSWKWNLRRASYVLGCDNSLCNENVVIQWWLHCEREKRKTVSGSTQQRGWIREWKTRQPRSFVNKTQQHTQTHTHMLNSLWEWNRRCQLSQQPCHTVCVYLCVCVCVCACAEELETKSVSWVSKGKKKKKKQQKAPEQDDITITHTHIPT